MRTRFDVPEISCETCKTSLEGALGPVPGVQEAGVDVAGKTVTVTYEPQTMEVSRLVEVIEEQGYDVAGHVEVS